MSADKAEEQQRRLLDTLDTGDVLLFNRKCDAMGSPLGIGVCWFAKWTSKYDHVGVVVKPKEAGAEPLVLEAGFQGVALRPISQRLDREHHNSVAVRHLLVESELAGGMTRDAVKSRIHDYAHQVEGAPYKHRMQDFLTGAAQTPEKREAIDVAAALNAAQRQDAALRRVAATAGAKTPAAAIADRRQVSLAREMDILQTGAMQHRKRTDERIPPFMAGNEPAKEAGFFCSELTAAAFQHASIMDAFPTAPNFGAHDWASLAAPTTADEVRHRRPPGFAPEAWLGPERLLKLEPSEAVSQRAPSAPDASEVAASLEALGWGFIPSATASRPWRPVYVQRGESIDLGPLAAPTTAVMGSGVRMHVLSTSDASDTERRAGRCEFLLPKTVPFGVETFNESDRKRTKKGSTADRSGGWLSDPKISTRRATAVAESEGYVWVADASEVKKARVEGETQMADASSEAADQLEYDPSRFRMRRSQSSPWVSRKSGSSKGVYALYVVESGTVADKSVDRVYRAGEVVGLDAFMAHLPASPMHGGWDGPMLTSRRVDAPEPIALRNGTELRMVTYAEVLSTGVIPALAFPKTTHCRGAKKPPTQSETINLNDLRARYQAFCTHTDGRQQMHQRNPDMEAHMDLVHRFHYFDLNTLPKSATMLLDTVLFQSRTEDVLMFSDIYRVEQACGAAVTLLKAGSSSRPQAVAAAYFLATQASPDGRSVSVTAVNELVHRIYRGRSDAPFIRSLAPNLAGKNAPEWLRDFFSDANSMSKSISIDEFVQAVELGTIEMPAAITGDTVMLIDHVAVKCLGFDPQLGESTYDLSRKTSEGGDESENAERPELHLSDELSKLVKGEAWDMSARSDAYDHAKRLTIAVACATGLNMLLYPFQVLQWQRQIFGKNSTLWSLKYILSKAGYYHTIIHTSHKIWFQRTLAGLVLTWAATIFGRPPEPMYDTELDEQLPTHPRWAALQFGFGVSMAVTAVTYPLEVMHVTALRRSAIHQEGAAIVNYYAAQAAPRSAMRLMWDTHGFRGIFRGAHWSVFAMTPFFGAHWLWYHELLVPSFTDRQYAPSALFHERPTPDAWYASSSPTTWWWKPGIVGAFYKMHSLATYPIETLRYMAMAQQEPVYKAVASAWRNSRGPFGSVRRLYAGWGVHMARQVPVMLASYSLFGAIATNYTVETPRAVTDKLRALNNRSLNGIHHFREVGADYKTPSTV